MAKLLFTTILEPEQWDKDKGKWAKLVTETGVGAGLTRLKQAVKRASDGIGGVETIALNLAPHDGGVELISDVIAAADSFITLANDAITALKSNKLAPKDLNQAIKDRLDAVKRVREEATQVLAAYKECIADTKELRKDPLKFLQSNPCALQEMLGEHITRAFTTTPSKTTTKPTLNLLKYTETTESIGMFVRDFVHAATVRSIVSVVAKDAPRITYLPYKEDIGTYTVLSSKALYCFTGPLSGCAVYVATCDRKEPLLIHTNCNEVENAAQNKKLKRDMAKAITALHPGYQLALRLERGEYKTPSFVFGARTGQGWKFFSHQLDGVAGFKADKKAEPLKAYADD